MFSSLVVLLDSAIFFKNILIKLFQRILIVRKVVSVLVILIFLLELCCYLLSSMQKNFIIQKSNYIIQIFVQLGKYNHLQHSRKAIPTNDKENSFRFHSETFHARLFNKIEQLSYASYQQSIEFYRHRVKFKRSSFKNIESVVKTEQVLIEK